jgi:hypothetical protein
LTREPQMGDLETLWRCSRRWGFMCTYWGGGDLEQLRHCLSVLITSAIETVKRDESETWQEIEFRLEVSRATNVAHIAMY